MQDFYELSTRLLIKFFNIQFPRQTCAIDYVSLQGILRRSLRPRPRTGG